VDAFTYDGVLHNSYPIVKSSQYMPEWWKKLPVSMHDDTQPHALIKFATMKRCNGFTDFYANSFTLPLWSDVSIELQLIEGHKVWRYKFADESSTIDTHDDRQFTNFVDHRLYQQFKFVSKWRLKEKTGVKFLMAHPTWNMSELNFKFQILPGVIDFKNQHALHINSMWKYPTEGLDSTLLEADTPLAHIIPLTDKAISIRTHLVSYEEYVQLYGNYKFTGKYKEQEKINERNQKKSCPFH